MSMPPLLNLSDEAAYRAHFEAIYCKAPIETFDGIAVRFRKSDFDHCCYKTKRGEYQKTEFCRIRGERIDWIKAALQDSGADLRVGWDNTRKVYQHNRRVAIVSGNYIVIIDLLKCGQAAQLVTAYLADSGSGNTLTKIKKSPKWPRKNDIKKPQIRQAGSAETFDGSNTAGVEQLQYRTSGIGNQEITENN